MKKKAAIIVFSIMGGVIVLLAGILFGFYLGENYSSPSLQQEELAATEPETKTPKKEAPQPKEDTISEPEKTVKMAPPAKPGTMVFSPYDEWKESYHRGLVKFNGAYDVQSLKSQEYYEIGTVTGQGYEDATVILADVKISSMGVNTSLYRFVADGNDLVLMEKYSDNPEYHLDLSRFQISDTLRIEGFEFPEEIRGPGARQVLNFAGDGYFFLGSGSHLFSTEGLVKAFAHQDLGDAYTTDFDEETESKYHSNGFYFRAPDGTVRVYHYIPDFFGENQIPEITWSDGTKNEDAYTYQLSSGCGSSHYINVMDPNEVSISGDLKITGTNSQGDKIYELKDSQHEILQKIYDERYNPWKGEKVSYAEFAASHPTIFWVDPFGRLIRAESHAFIPMAECAKPVIYLYPEKETRVSVQVKPGLGITVSEPDYGDGWDVIAQPTGELFDLGSQEEHPYLFWEGRSDEPYQIPDRGFVVKKEEAEKFLWEKLALLGLNRQESADFIEFWLPYMQEDPYYFVTFLGNREMDAIAPLAVVPQPDTVIRMFMDFLPLEKPIDVQGYEIQTPKRDGFTLVEWGGARR